MPTELSLNVSEGALRAHFGYAGGCELGRGHPSGKTSDHPLMTSSAAVTSTLTGSNE